MSKMIRGARLRHVEITLGEAITACQDTVIAMQEVDTVAARHFEEAAKDMIVYLDLWRKKHGLPGRRPRLPLR